MLRIFTVAFGEAEIAKVGVMKLVKPIGISVE
jgi:hypothetical protein